MGARVISGDNVLMCCVQMSYLFSQNVAVIVTTLCLFFKLL